MGIVKYCISFSIKCGILIIISPDCETWISADIAMPPIPDIMDDTKLTKLTEVAIF